MRQAGAGVTMTLREWREARGWTIDQAAAHLEVPRSTYAGIERGYQTPRRELLEYLSARTGVSKAVLAGVA